MKNLFLLCCILGAGLLLHSCGTEENPVDGEQNLTINFKAEYDGVPLVFYDEYAYGDAILQITNSDFYVSNIVLEDADGNETKIDEVFYIDFTQKNDNQALALEGLDIILNSIPVRSYTKIKMGIGLDEEKNGTLPSDYNSSNPMSISSNYWSTWDSYIFLRHQGLYTDANVEDRGWLWHIGTDALYREIELPINLDLSATNNNLVIKIDHKKLFNTASGLFDILSSPENHRPEINEAMDMMADNYQTAFSL